MTIKSTRAKFIGRGRIQLLLDLKDFKYQTCLYVRLCDPSVASLTVIVNAITGFVWAVNCVLFVGLK